MKSRTTAVGKIELTHFGDPTIKRKLICLHGGPGMDYSCFLPYLYPLSKEAELIFYTQGNSSAPSIEGLVDELATVVNFFRGSEIFLLGHSFGGALALEYTHRVGLSRIAGLVLVSWVYDDKWFARSSFKHSDLRHSLLAAQAHRESNRTIQLSQTEKYKETMLDFAPLYFTPANLALGRRVLENTHFNGELFFSIMDGYLQKFDLRQELNTVSIPTLSILGTEDGVVDAEYIRAGLADNPRIEQHEISNASHFPFVEDPSQFNSIVKEFLIKKGVNP
jgi:proline iminopeptidase